MDDHKEETKIEPTRRKIFTQKCVIAGSIGIIACLVGYIHYRYVSTLFENDRDFSYLSELEREMSLRTEMGFYYSYYKTIVEERPFVAAITKLMYDRLVEYPKEVNAFNRFNIHPEVLIGGVYRYFEPWLNTTAHRHCHIVQRGEGLTPVESCVGIGEPVFFYLEAIWWLAGLTVAVLFLYATALSHSILGGVLAVAQYFANHSNCTRVQWTPNERENFALPLLLLQCWLLSLQLARAKPTSATLQVSIFILNCLCLLFWQFTQFIFLTQTAIFFVMEQLRIIDTKTLCVFLHSHFCGLHMAVLLLQGNDMLKSSLYASFFIVISTYCLFFSSLRIKVQNRFDLAVEAWLVLLRIAIVTCTSLYLKKIISNFLEVEEDSHVWDILYSKFTNYKSFHTSIYTCSEVFDFLPLSTVEELFSSFLIPSAVIGLIIACKRWISNAISYTKQAEAKNRITERDGDISDASDSGIENSDNKKKLIDLDRIDKEINSKMECDELVTFLQHLNIEPAVFYNGSQLVMYAAMAALVMRLKLLFVTQLCIVSSLVMDSGFKVPKRFKRFVPFVWLVASMPLLRALILNMSQEMSHIGEFTDIRQEQLLEWIKNATDSNAAFAGSMPVLATVLLATRRPIVAHPHYEHKEARDRAYAVYKTYGRFSPHELYQELTKLRAIYLIVETKYCYGRSSKGCSFEEIWEVERAGLAGKVSACHALLTQPVEHFHPVFHNDDYMVFYIHDYSVIYMPRSFDT